MTQDREKRDQEQVLAVATERVTRPAAKRRHFRTSFSTGPELDGGRSDAHYEGPQCALRKILLKRKVLIHPHPSMRCELKAIEKLEIRQSRHSRETESCSLTGKHPMVISRGSARSSDALHALRSLICTMTLPLIVLRQDGFIIMVPFRAGRDRRRATSLHFFSHTPCALAGILQPLSKSRSSYLQSGSTMRSQQQICKHRRRPNVASLTRKCS